MCIDRYVGFECGHPDKAGHVLQPRYCGPTDVLCQEKEWHLTLSRNPATNCEHCQHIYDFIQDDWTLRCHEWRRDGIPEAAIQAAEKQIWKSQEQICKAGVREGPYNRTEYRLRPAYKEVLHKFENFVTELQELDTKWEREIRALTGIVSETFIRHRHQRRNYHRRNRLASLDLDAFESTQQELLNDLYYERDRSGSRQTVWAGEELSEVPIFT